MLLGYILYRWGDQRSSESIRKQICSEKVLQH